MYIQAVHEGDICKCDTDSADVYNEISIENLKILASKLSPTSPPPLVAVLI